MEPRVVAQEQASTAPQTLGDPGRSARRWLPRLTLPGIGLRASERRLLLLVVDLAVVVGALVYAILSGADWLDPPGAFFALWRWWATLAVLWWLMANLLECYDLARAASAPHSIIPSRLTFTMPAFSEIASPIDALRSGVEKRMAAWRKSIEMNSLSSVASTGSPPSS